jgi:dTDP-glucose 4,6-dehydratase
MSTFTPRKVLLTGGAGFIGSNLVHHLLAETDVATIVNLDALTYAASLDNLDGLAAPERHRLVHGNICDAPLVERLLREHAIDTIVHLAAESHVDRSISGPAVFVSTNVVGTYTLLEAARRVWLEERKLEEAHCRFCHVSTDEVFGSLAVEDSAFTETTPYDPRSPYSATKAGSDHLVRAYRHTYGLPVVLSNCSNNYGPRQHAEKFIPTIIRSCLAGAGIPVYGNGGNIRDWLFVGDHCRAIDLVLRRGRPGESYNIGGGTELSNIDLVGRLCAMLDHAAPEGAPHARLIEFVTDRPGHDWRYAMDTGKIHSELSWSPSESLESGLVKTIEWYLGRHVPSKSPSSRAPRSDPDCAAP